jgi:hypothetical protein
MKNPLAGKGPEIGKHYCAHADLTTCNHRHFKGGFNIIQYFRFSIRLSLDCRNDLIPFAPCSWTWAAFLYNIGYAANQTYEPI